MRSQAFGSCRSFLLPRLAASARVRARAAASSFSARASSVGREEASEAPVRADLDEARLAQAAHVIACQRGVDAGGLGGFSDREARRRAREVEDGPRGARLERGP